MGNYATTTEAETYLEANKLDYSAWTDATTTQRSVSLTMATNIIDRLNFKGEMTDEDQDNQFPRDDDTTVPTAIQNASIEIAYSLLDGVDIEEERSRLNLSYEQYASVKAGYKDHIYKPYIAAGVPSSVAWDLLVPFLRDPGRILYSRDS